MRLLLDTHTFLWFVLDDGRLAPKARDLIADANDDVYLSPASVWEIAIEMSLGKYQLPGPFADFLDEQLARNAFPLLPITVAHAAIVSALPFHHRDPFDRLIVARAVAEGLDLVSRDLALDAYGIHRVWS